LQEAKLSLEKNASLQNFHFSQKTDKGRLSPEGEAGLV